MDSLTETLGHQHGTKANIVPGSSETQMVGRTSRLEGIMQTAIDLSWGDFVCGQMVNTFSSVLLL